jgi:pyrroloquinoline-quinone synthase
MGTRAPRVLARAQAAIQESGLLANPYFTALHDGSLSLQAFRRTQEQFFFAVTFFSRPMAALIGRIDDPALRLDILHNLVEEHGEFERERFHHNTFREFLRRIGSDPDALSGKSLWPALRAFNSVLTAACVLDELEVGIACMGVIEQSFAKISASIGSGVVQRGWLNAKTLIHYKLHAEIDERHAEEFFAVIEPRWDDLERRYYIDQGLQLGVYIFDNLYRSLFLRSEDAHMQGT